MLKHERTLLASASDIVNYLGCAHRMTLDLIDLETPLEKAPDDEEMQLVQEKGRAQQDGLEYLFGVVCRGGGEWTFRRWWAHGRTEERAAFEGFMDFVAGRLERFPDLHIYHYHHYEPSALKALMSKHGVREVELDDLLRGERFVDLYRAVREALRISEPGYSPSARRVLWRRQRCSRPKDRAGGGRKGICPRAAELPRFGGRYVRI